MEAPIFSEYEKERLKNIQRNEDYLQQLGFEGKPYAAPIANKVKPVKRKKMYNEENEYTEPVRRSSRVASQEPVSYIEANILVTSKGIDSQSHALRSEQSVVYGDLPVGTKTGVELQPTLIEGVSSGATTGTCSSMNADLSYFLGSYTTDDALVSSKSAFQEKKRTSNMSADGKSAEEHRLCQPIAHYGKAAVMSLSNHGSLPRFSKYAGALEWLNCVYLWVNLGGTSGYSNAFSEKGRHIMWFGGSKMHQESKIIQRMVRADKASQNVDIKVSNRHSGETIILFVRVEGENYCCLGRLKWVAIDLLSSPVKIKWELLDYDLFCNSPHFKRVLSEGGLS